ncbi:MAG TPA: CARDB domain-containing protein [Thermoanaerobaculia bacterium]|jgi:PKD repeat protein
MKKRVLLLLLLVAPAAFAAGPDLGVAYVERTPRYSRYVIDESRGLPQQLAPGTENDKRWPDVGETVTYIGHVRNHGDQPAAAFRYQWLVDGVVTVAAQNGPALAAGAEGTVRFSLPWTGLPQRIELVVDPQNEMAETVESNNKLAVGSHDLTLSIWVEQGMYDSFTTTPFEDWLQGQIAWMNQRFAGAVYPTSPAGIIDRVRVEKIVIATDLDGLGSPMHNDPDFTLIDGRWPFSDGDPTNARDAGGSWAEYAAQFIGRIDHGLVHELTHQVGVIDLYRMNIKNDEPGSPNGGVSVKDASGRLIPYSRLPFPVFCCGGLMGGGDIRPYPDGTHFESHTAAGMNAHARKRRGHFGEYLFDTPRRNYIRVLDAQTRTPIANARVAMYQKDYNTEDIDDAPEITGTTNARGRMLLPDRPVLPVTTVTGHTLRPNPFGQISNLGVNGTMLVRVTTRTTEGLAFFRLHDLNLAAAQKSTNEVEPTYDLLVNLTPIAAPPSNAAPVLAPIGPRRVAEGEVVSFTVQAKDRERDPIAITAPRMPPGATFVANVFRWQPTFTQAGFHSVTFSVEDANGGTDSETILITVTNVNAPPVASVGPDQLVGPGAIATLDGSFSSDLDNDVLQYQWRQISGRQVVLLDARASVATFQAPSVAATLAFELTVSDGRGTSASRPIAVTVHPSLTLSGQAQSAPGKRSWRQPCRGSDRVLIVTSAEWRADDASGVSAIRYGGVPLTKLAQIYHPATGPLATMWYLVNPPEGLHEVIASAAVQASFASSCWYGIEQTAPSNFNTAISGGTTLSVTVASDAASFVVDAVAAFGENPADSLSASSSQTLLVDTYEGHSRAVHSARDAVAGTTTMSWQTAGGDMRAAIIGAVLARRN